VRAAISTSIGVIEDFTTHPWVRRFAAIPLGPVAILVALVIVFTISQSNFFGVTSFQAVGANAAVVFIFAVGETFVILTGRIDLSVGGIASLTTVILPKFIPSVGWFAIPAVVAIFAIVGVIQGVLHLALRLPSFVVTIAGLFVWDGAALAVSNGDQIPIPFGNDPTGWLSGNQLVGGIPVSMIDSLVVAVLAGAALRMLPFGRRVYAVGVSERAAILAGLPVWRTVLTTFAISGACAALAGVMLLANFGAGNAGFADSQLLPALTAVIIGGTAITGGVGGMFRTLIGSVILSVLLVGMTVAGWAPELQQVIYGLVLIAAMVVTTNRKRITVIK
jgi:ribose transport system permease protein